MQQQQHEREGLVQGLIVSCVRGLPTLRRSETPRIVHTARHQKQDNYTGSPRYAPEIFAQRHRPATGTDQQRDATQQQQQLIQRKRKGDRLEKYFNKAHSYFPTLIHRCSPNGYCTVIISNYFPAAHRLMPVWLEWSIFFPFGGAFSWADVCAVISSSFITCGFVALMHASCSWKSYNLAPALFRRKALLLERFGTQSERL